MSPTMQARRARVRQIRRTVTAVAVTVFIAVFATIYIQMAVGKDPALGSSTNTAQVSQTAIVTRRVASCVTGIPNTVCRTCCQR